MVVEAPATSYDEVPYASDPYPQSHPDHLATVATFFGMTPAPVDRCRVLELGCARGGNLIPLALALPGSRFVGIDSSAHQVAAAREVIAALGLDNIELSQRSILDVDAGYGPFDYIICHGTYSWVPSEVQDKILAVCARNLAPGGVAYVSYNTYPGWRLRGLVRDLLCYHVRRYARPQDRAAEARALLDFMARSVSPEDRSYSSLLSSSFADFEEGSLIKRILRFPCGLLANCLGYRTSTDHQDKETDPWNLPPRSSTCYRTSPRSSPHPLTTPSSPSSPAGSSPSGIASSPRSSSPAATSAMAIGRDLIASSAMPPGTSTPSPSSWPGWSSRSSPPEPPPSGPSMTPCVASAA